MVNVGKYTKHGASGYDMSSKTFQGVLSSLYPRQVVLWNLKTLFYNSVHFGGFMFVFWCANGCNVGNLKNSEVAPQPAGFSVKMGTQGINPLGHKHDVNIGFILIHISFCFEKKNHPGSS